MNSSKDREHRDEIYDSDRNPFARLDGKDDEDAGGNKNINSSKDREEKESLEDPNRNPFTELD